MVVLKCDPLDEDTSAVPENVLEIQILRGTPDLLAQKLCSGTVQVILT